MKNKLILLGISLLLIGCTQTGSDDVSLGSNTESNLELSAETQIGNTNQESTQETMANDQELLSAETVVLKTSKGDITLKLYPDTAPQTVSNFLTKANENFYTDLTFHRVEDWVIQGGDPLGTGTGGGSMPTELSQVEFKEGSLGVARGGNIEISNDSQFFICTQDCGWLTGQYTNFGEVVEGMDVVKDIAIGDTIVGLEVTE